MPRWSFLFIYLIFCNSVWIYWALFWGEGESSLTLLSLVRGWVNPLLSRTHAAPVQHRFAQNASVRFCSGARQWGRQQTRKAVIHTHVQTHMGHVTSVCHLSSVDPVSNLITVRPVTGVGVGSLSQSALTQEQEICFLPLVALIWSSHRC